MVKFKNKKLIERPKKTGLYDPASEKDSCGVGLVANIKGNPSREIMDDAYLINSRMDHRGGSKHCLRWSITNITIYLQTQKPIHFTTAGFLAIQVKKHD